MESKTKALVEGYFQKAEKKLLVAEKLFRSDDYDDAVSRAYYAMFHAAQALLLTEGQQAATHKGIVTLFSLIFVKTGKFRRDLGKYLANLKDDRESGDYEAFSYVDKETAERAVREAKEFVKETTGYLTTLGVLS